VCLEDFERKGQLNGCNKKGWMDGIGFEMWNVNGLMVQLVVIKPVYSFIQDGFDAHNK
jgi:hypothetical protein